MDQQFVLLSVAVLGASMLQSATGIGFGVIAGPVLLMALNSGAAIQISIVLSFLIAIVLAPSLWRKTDRRLLVQFLTGSVVGLPVGLLIFLTIGIGPLKALAGLAVLLTLVFVLRNRGAAGSRRPRATVIEGMSMGVASGVMSGSLAMPGPIPAAWMSARDYDKDTVRATILTLFVFSYLAAFVLQAIMAEISRQTLWLGFTLAPATLVGVLLGRLLATRLTEVVFRWLLIAVLATTAAGLFYNSIPSLVSR